MTADRQPCPACQGDWGIMQRGDPPHDYVFFMGCVRCWAHTGVFWQRSRALNAWNRGKIKRPVSAKAATCAALQAPERPATDPRPFYRASLQRLIEDTTASGSTPGEAIEAIEEVAERFDAPPENVLADVWQMYEDGNYMA